METIELCDNLLEYSLAKNLSRLELSSEFYTRLLELPSTPTEIELVFSSVSKSEMEAAFQKLVDDRYFDWDGIDGSAIKITKLGEFYRAKGGYWKEDERRLRRGVDKSTLRTNRNIRRSTFFQILISCFILLISGMAVAISYWDYTTHEEELRLLKTEKLLRGLESLQEKHTEKIPSPKD